MISEGIETNHSLKTPRKYMKKPHSQVYFQKPDPGKPSFDHH